MGRLLANLQMICPWTLLFIAKQELLWSISYMLITQPLILLHTMSMMVCRTWQKRKRSQESRWKEEYVKSSDKASIPHNSEESETQRYNTGKEFCTHCMHGCRAATSKWQVVLLISFSYFARRRKKNLHDGLLIVQHWVFFLFLFTALVLRGVPLLFIGNDG